MAAAITVNLNDADEALLGKITTEFNALVPNNPAPLTNAQMLRQTIRDWLRTNADRYAEVARLTVREAYRKASAEDQAAVDALLAKYR